MQNNKNINLNDLPELPQDFYNELIKYKCPSKTENQPKTENPPKTEKKPITENKKTEDTTEENKIMELVDILDVWRVNNYNQWYNIGQTIYNINKDYINIFDAFSKKSEKHYNIKEIYSKWNEYKKPIGNGKINLTIGTLRDNAHKDNPELYKKWCLKYGHNTKISYEEIK